MLLGCYLFSWERRVAIPTVNANGKIFSFDSKTGVINWTLETGSQNIKSHNGFKIAISSDKLLFTNDIGVVNCIDLVKKNFLWSVSIENFSNTKVFKVSNIVTENNNLYLSSNYLP